LLTLAELRRVREVLNDRLRGHVVERFVQPDADRVVVSLYGRAPDGEAGRKRFLLFCCRPGLARVSEVDALPRAPDNPPAFVSWLRAHLGRARLEGARLIGDDRILAVRLSAREGFFDLVLAILGRRSNVYVLDATGTIVAVLRPPADTRPELTLGAVFAPPESRAPRAGDDRFADSPDDALLAAIERDYAEREAERDTEGLLRDLRQALKRERKQAARRLEKIEAELAEADEANTLQRHGELLKGALGRIAPGDTAVRVRDYETGQEVAIALDPKKSPRENLEATFKRYQKLLRRLAKAGGQVDAAREWSATVEALEAELAAAAPEGAEPDAEALARLVERPEVARLLGRRHTAQAAGVTARTGGEAAPALPARLRGVPTRLLPRRYASRDGLEIWVGRSDAGNDYLTTRLARGNDLFFHLDGAPGSHVVLRTEGRPDPPQESVLDACELAVHFSKQKNASRADVHVVPIKQVRKPKGAKPGLVWVTGGRSLHLRREESRLERLLASRIDG
jgi:predicted ribosome quality control (RQC) complex YloA/Tae2 family protein